MVSVLHDGDGMCIGPAGERRWGLHGAAGLLLRAPAEDGTPLILMQHRAPWTNSGGTWGLPGGAVDSHESATEGALREVEEETAIALDPHRVRWTGVTSQMHCPIRIEREFHPQGNHTTSDGRTFFPREVHRPVLWTYTTVVGDITYPVSFTANEESLELAWIPEDEVEELPLIPGFSYSWPGLRTEPAQLLIDMDSAVGDLSARTKWWQTARSVADQLFTHVVLNRPWLWRKLDADEVLDPYDPDHSYVPQEAGFWWTSTARLYVSGRMNAAEQLSPLPWAAQGFVEVERCGTKTTTAEALYDVARFNSAKAEDTIVVTDNEDLIAELPVEYVHIYSPEILGLDDTQ